MFQMYRIRVHKPTENFEVHLAFHSEQEAVKWCDKKTQVACAYEGLPAYSYIGVLYAS